MSHSRVRVQSVKGARRHCNKDPRLVTWASNHKKGHPKMTFDAALDELVAVSLQRVHITCCLTRELIIHNSFKIKSLLVSGGPIGFCDERVREAVENSLPTYNAGARSPATADRMVWGYLIRVTTGPLFTAPYGSYRKALPSQKPCEVVI